MRNAIALLMFLVFGFGLSNVAAQTNAPVKKISGGILNGKATSLAKPAYPAAAKAVNASGAVNVQVTIDENGAVVSASAVSGHPLLRQAAEQAARASTFSPTLLSGQPVSVTGVLVYNFVSGMNWLSEGVTLGIAERKGIKGAADLPEEFKAEREQLEAIAKLPADEQKYQLASTVSLIKGKLNAVDLWRFEFGLAKGKIVGSLEANDADGVSSNLAEFKRLAENKPEGIQEYEVNRAVELAKYAEKVKLSAEDKQGIFSYLK